MKQKNVHISLRRCLFFTPPLLISAELRPGQADVRPAQERGEPGDHQGRAQRAWPGPRRGGLHEQREEQGGDHQARGGGAGGGGAALRALPAAAGQAIMLLWDHYSVAR